MLRIVVVHSERKAIVVTNIVPEKVLEIDLEDWMLQRTDDGLLRWEFYCRYKALSKIVGGVWLWDNSVLCQTRYPRTRRLVT